MDEFNLPPLNKHIRLREIPGLNRRKITFYILIAVLVSSMVLIYVWTFVKMSEARINFRDLTKESLKLEKEYNHLKVKHAQLSNPSRIEKIATEKLNMTLPMRVEFLSIEYYDNESN